MGRGAEASSERRDKSKLTSWQVERTLWLGGLVVGQDPLRNGIGAYGEKGAQADGGGCTSTISPSARIANTAFASKGFMRRRNLRYGSAFCLSFFA
jgi:hypothetical protein